MSGRVEREISKAVSVGVVGRKGWEQEAECPVEAELDDVRVGGSQKWNEVGGNVSSESSVACSRQGNFSTHDRRLVLCALFDYVIGS